MRFSGDVLMSLLPNPRLCLFLVLGVATGFGYARRRAEGRLPLSASTRPWSLTLLGAACPDVDRSQSRSWRVNYHTRIGTTTLYGLQDVV